MRKKFTNHCARKTTVRKLKKAKIVSSGHITNVTGHRGINFLNLTTMKSTKKSYDDSCSRPNEIMKSPALLKSKCYINTGSFRHHNNCGSTHPSMAASECFKDHKVVCWSLKNSLVCNYLYLISLRQFIKHIF